MSYFSQFSKLNYTFPDGKVRLFNNLSIRLNLLDRVKKEDTRFENYYITDGDTPDTVSYKVYQKPDYHWCLLLANNIFNVYKQWPKTNIQLEEYVIEKYTNQKNQNDSDIILSRTAALEFANFKGSPSNGYEESDGVYGVIYRPKHFVDDENNIYSFDSAFGESMDAFGRTITRPTLTPISHYEYEFDINEDNRNILLPSLNMIEQMENELRKLLKG
tara:strand:- start:1835 stop:2485 length:651 start_codon:yes stop_codon:yes gene_type:complete